MNAGTPVPPQSGDGIDPAVLDLSRVVEAFGALDGDARDLLTQFADAMDGMLRELEVRLIDGRAAEAREVAHRARSAAGSIGAAAMHRLLVDVEAALAEGRIADARRGSRDLGPAFVALRQVLDRL